MRLKRQLEHLEAAPDTEDEARPASPEPEVGQGGEARAPSEAREENSPRWSFGELTWGMDMEQVRRHYPRATALKERPGWLFVEEYPLGDVEGALGFQFHEGELMSVAWVGTERYSNKNKHIVDFDTVSKLLVLKYGEPVANEINWDNDLLRDDSQQYGLAIAMGHLELQQRWEGDDTRILLALDGQNMKVRLSLFYMDLERWERFDESRTSEALEKL